ncbi:MAG TPA: DNA translocase FtsK 4TM domain-containing protein [Terriglobales bacterium]|nr:DNA translocase FtsK 4TM domain-containing protein [Terriglobales bacterium]
MARANAAATKVVAPPSTSSPTLANEVAGLLVMAASLFGLISLVWFQLGDGRSHLVGPVGQFASQLALDAIGFTVYLIPLMLVRTGLRIFRSGFRGMSYRRTVGITAMLLSIAVLLGLLEDPASGFRPGGWFGGFTAAILRDACGTLGTAMLAAIGLLLAMMFATGASLHAGLSTAGEQTRTRWQGWRARRAEKRAQQQKEQAVIEQTSQNRRRLAEVSRAAGPVILLREDSVVVPPASRPPAQEPLPFAADSDYQYPSLNLLDTPVQVGAGIDEEALRRSSEILEAKLGNFGIEGKVVAVRPGPVITTFEIEPAPGVKVNRIVTLQDDLTMALRALGVRILAPIPGKSVVGIEVANAAREKVFLREILESEPFAHEASPLTLALGKDSAGKPVVADLARMPHLLLAGATGSGKSVALNALIMSMLFKSSPRDVRFVMIDPKMLELSLYEDLPHLLVPVVTDAKKAVVVLKNMVETMEERYRLLKQKGVRNLDGYNRLIAGLGGDDDEEVIELTDALDDEEEMSDRERALRNEPMPKIVVVIDELADLMMVAGRQAEEPITRLAQKARACGIHLIVATQRPSVDVITGLIKANFPSRISFQVTSRVDSRTILDQIGAERLLGGGDMLYLLPGTARVQRIHGAYVSEAEIKKVTNFVRRQGRPQYVMELLEGGEEDGGGDGFDDELADEMYDQAVRLVTESRQASISWVQRRLRVGYNRAARMIERMEKEGVVSSSEGGRPREVLARAIED